MNDAEFDVQKARIGKLIERWVKPIGLGWWALDFAYVRDDFQVDGKNEPETIMSTSARWRYLTATISCNMPRVAEQSDDKLERQFVHELTHVFVNECREDGKDWLDHEERVATTLADAFLWIREHEHDETLKDLRLKEERERPLVLSTQGWTAGNDGNATLA